MNKEKNPARRYNSKYICTPIISASTFIKQTFLSTKEQIGQDTVIV
jgi:hypothetical protein